MKFGLKSLMLLAIVIFCQQMQGQTMADAVAAYNNGANLQATDLQGSIKALEECVAICDKIGTAGDSLKNSVSKVIPKLYAKKAGDLAEAKKYAESIVAYDEAVKVAEKYGDSETAEKAKSKYPQLYYAAGFDAYNLKNDADAVTYLEKAAQIDASNTKPLYLLTVVYKRMNNSPKFLETLGKTIEVAKAQGDKATEDKANNLGKSYYTAAFSNNTKANKLNEAVESMKKALEFAPEDKDLTFYLGQTYNKVKKYDLAIETLKKAVALETGSAEAKAKYYFELGNAYVAKNDTANACDAFKNAQFGKYAENAKYQITTVLKCK